MLKHLLPAIAAALCLSSPVSAAPLEVVASFSVLGDMAREVGGDAIAVTTLVGPNGDAHVYQPSPADATAVARADIVIFNGLGFEPWGKRLLEASATTAAVVEVAQGVTPRAIDAAAEPGEADTGDGNAPIDPHAWQDLSNGVRYVANIAQALAAARPADAAAIHARADAYTRRLTELDAWVRSELGNIPEAERKVITAHDAFGYFGDAYGVTFLAPVGISTEAEPTPRDVAHLIRQMQAENVRVVFLENMTGHRLVSQLAKDADGVIGGTLYADALSAADGPAATYEAMFRHNVTALKAALSRE